MKDHTKRAYFAAIESVPAVLREIETRRGVTLAPWGKAK